MERNDFPRLPSSTGQVLAFHIAKALDDLSHLDAYLRAAHTMSSMQMLSILGRLAANKPGVALAERFRQEIRN